MNALLQSFVKNDDLTGFKQLWTFKVEEDEIRNVTWGFIHHAACDGSLKCLQYLLDRGVDPNTGTRKRKHTPLAISVINVCHNRDVVSTHMLLLKYGGNPFLRNAKGEDTFHVPAYSKTNLSHLEAYLVVDLVCGEADNFSVDIWRVVKHYIL